jgi:predicted nucleotidyltransferase
VTRVTDPPDSHDPSPEATEGFYLETEEGLFFAVKGFEHSPDRYIAVLRYAPDARNGTRWKNGISYRRYYGFSEQVQLLKKAYPRYLSFDPVFQAHLQSVPRPAVRAIYDPRDRFAELNRNFQPSRLEKDAADFLSLLQSESKVASNALGLTGSLLIGLHTEQSDIDAVVFGEGACRKVHQTLRRLIRNRSCPEIEGLDSAGMRELYTQRVADTPMEFDAFRELENRKVNQGRFRDRTYFIRFVRSSDEEGAYGKSSYTPLGRAVITGTVTDDRDSIFTPCKYPLSGVRILDGPQVVSLDAIVSYRGRFCEQAFSGEAIKAAGTLERVLNSDGTLRYRLLLDNSYEDSLNLFVS